MKPEADSNVDHIFRDDSTAVEDFRFDARVTAVFDDMLERSVPFYSEIQRMVAEIAAEFAEPGSHVYDLGCSTGNTLLNLNQVCAPGVALVGVDNSPTMLEHCRSRLEQEQVARPFEFVDADLNRGIEVRNASVVVMNLTLQFIRPLYREKLLRQVFEGLNHNGCLLLVEKVVGNDSMLNRLFIDFYYRKKREQGYSDLEISRKREALENVLIPYRLEENLELLQQTGFGPCDVFFKWYNFAGIIAVKS